jgi:exopolysaccharide production protein ExoZ
VSGAPNAPAREDKRILSIQYLRACAALMVVLHHAASQFPDFPGPFHTVAGQAGVDLFFVISGFVMVFVTSTREQTAGTFLYSRATRIIPVYWFYTFACLGMLLVAPSLFTMNEASVRHLVLSLLFVPHAIAGSPSEYAPLVKLGWTLDYEVFFYTLFALAMVISVQRRVLLATLALFALVITPVVGLLFGLQPVGVAGFYTESIVAEFAFGMLIAVAYFRHKFDWLGVWPAAVVIVLGFAVMIADAPHLNWKVREFEFGLPAAAIVICALAIERRGRVGNHRLMTLIGDASYSIYLVHIFPLSLLRFAWRRLGVPTHGWFFSSAFVVSSLVCAVTIGVASYYLIERPSLKLLRRSRQT